MGFQHLDVDINVFLFTDRNGELGYGEYINSYRTFHYTRISLYYYYNISIHQSIGVLYKHDGGHSYEMPVLMQIVQGGGCGKCIKKCTPLNTFGTCFSNLCSRKLHLHQLQIPAIIYTTFW